MTHSSLQQTDFAPNPHTLPSHVICQRLEGEIFIAM